MAKTTYLSISPGLEQNYWHALQPQDRFIISRVRVKKLFISKTELEKIEARSYLKNCSNVWSGFSTEQKALWKSIDYHPRKHGWRCFISDQCKRIKYALIGSVLPSEYYQSMVGELLIEAPATELKIAQPHPYTYYISKKVAGTKNMWEPVAVNEYLTLPLTIGLSYKTALIAAGPNPSARFYATVMYLYQGQNLYQDLEINLPLTSDWTRDEVTLTTLGTNVVSYNLYFELKDVQGKVFFDNVLAQHSGQNWARDIYCQKIEQGFTRGFYQVPKHWTAVTLPSGANYQSIYYPFMQTSRIRVYLADTSQTIPTEEFTKIQFNAKSYDELSEFDNITNFRFTALEEGYYLVNTQLFFIYSGVGVVFYCDIRKNGTIQVDNRIESAVTNQLFINTTDVVYLDEGDYIEIWTYQDSGGNKDVYKGSVYSYLDIHKLSS